ncbi:polyketide cyclase [Nocardioides gansuensis]|uniref:Polyketide cyclase n=2 Tax=Nocardioides gansuensis TaxID=2138300 RepID=A0A2T8FGL5_9ACTN|nr:polyketide cyclase [Nocardioides gansuensis]
MPHPPEVVFTYLADPRNRPEWQASLTSVTLTDRSEPHVGMTWRESTLVGVRPRLEITHLEPCRLWAERGRWHGVTATLALRFTAIPGGTRVRADGEVTARGPWGAAAAAAGRLASRAVKADLERAARVLARA